MSGEVVIRRLVPEDAAAYRDIRLKALLMHPQAYSSSFEDEAREPLDFFARRLANALGCFVESTLVGTASLIAAPGLARRHKGLVVGVFLDPSHRGHGLARQLMEAVIQEARAAGLSAVRLGVTVGNEAAERLYRVLGFREYGVEVEAIRVGDIGFDEELMELALE